MLRLSCLLLFATGLVTAQGSEAITVDTLAGPIRFLASDLLEGRGVGSRGDELSRAYLESQFRFLGLGPGAADGSYHQAVPIVGIKSKISAPLAAEGQGGAITFEGPTDFTAWTGRPSPESRWDGLPVVFVGYGITAPEQQWNDFKDADVKGKVLLVMNNDPAADPTLFAGKTRLYYGRWSYKYEEAARRGAAGVIIIHTDPSAGYPFQVIQAGHEQEKFNLPFDPSTPTLEIEAWASNDASSRLAALGGHDLDALRAKAESRDFVPVDLGVKVKLSTQNTVREFHSGNVLAKVAGSDPILASEVVVLTAHFDHLGIGPPKDGDPIYNGALDNASGCAAMLALAKAMERSPLRPKRTVLFAAVTAEESGLLGSLHLAKNLPVPVKKVIANFNIDGINMWGPTEDIGMIGHGKNSLTALAEEIAAKYGRRVQPDQEPDKGLFYRSDHFNFARVGIPCAYFKAGGDFLEKRDSRRRIKAAYTTTYYHTPKDEIDERWNLEGAVLDTRLIFDCLLSVANADRHPSWTPGDEFEKLR